MDRLIKRFDCVADGDLMLAEHRGVAWQRNMGIGRVAYDGAYLEKFAAYDSQIADAVNAGRCALLAKYLPAGARVLDYGAGDGAFLRAALANGLAVKGFDVIPEIAERLRADDLFADNPAAQFDAICLWDVLEHLEDPEILLKHCPKGQRLFASIPVFDDLHAIRDSKHYRPGEHLYYWTAAGFVAWMALHGFRLIEQSDHETAAGRESIGAFVFCKDLPDYHDHVAAYAQMHATRVYGDSATELYLPLVTSVVKALRVWSILDYGCGRSDLVAHFYKDGGRRIARYDPAIPRYKAMPDGGYDLILCIDVLEHIPMAAVDRVLKEIRAKGEKALFIVSLKPSRAKLPDGRNAHVTLLTRKEWRNWLKSYFGTATEVTTGYPEEVAFVCKPETPQ